MSLAVLYHMYHLMKHKHATLKMWLRSLVALFFPERCCACGEELVGEHGGLCISCHLHLPLSNFAMRPANPTEMRLAGRIPFVAATSYLIFTHGNITQSLLHAIKYRHATQLAKQFGRQLGLSLRESHRFDDVDVIVPVPLHRKRLWYRGYNQSLLLCEGIAEVFSRPIDWKGLRRKVDTGTQTHLSREQRADNMKGVFALRHADSFAGKHILLVDDVLTTGATIEACWLVLKEVPDIRISIATLAIADGI